MKVSGGFLGKILIGCMVISLVIVMIGCTTALQTAEKSFASGNYLGAIESALVALQEEPGMIEARQILTSAWTQANDEWEALIARYEQALDVWEFEKAQPYYDDLFRIHTMVKDAGKSSLNPVPTEISERRENFKQNAAEMHVFEGSKLIVPGTRDEAKVALTHFLRAKELDSTYPFIDDKISQTRKIATARVFVFTGPDTNFGLNGIELVAAIEDGLDRLEGVEAVRVPNRYAAPIDDNHKADEFAKGHKANLMLHIEPDTSYSVSVKKDSGSLNTVPWQRETLQLVASGKTNIRYVLINLENDTIVSEGSFTVSDSEDGGFSVSAILHGGLRNTVELGDEVGARQLLVNEAPVGMNDITMLYQLKHNDGLDIPDYASGMSLNVQAATYGTGEKIVPEKYSHPSEMAVVTDLNNHTFWLFDAIVFDSYEDGTKRYQLVYQQQLKVGTEGHLITAAYDRDLYRKIEEWMRKPAIQKSMMDRFFPTFYRQTVPSGVVREVAKLF